MVGRREIKMAGAIQNNLLKHAEIWIINRKQGNEEQQEQERHQDRHLHDHHILVLQWAARHRGHQDRQVEEAEVAAAEEAGVKSRI